MSSTKFQLLKFLLLSFIIEAYTAVDRCIYRHNDCSLGEKVFVPRTTKETFQQDNLCVYRTRGCPLDEEEEEWRYRGSTGPSSWGYAYPSCNGKYQSPIDIRTDDVEKDDTLSTLDFKNYDQVVTPSKISNIRNRIELEVDDGVNRTITVNGGTYNLWQLHFHWGCTCMDGSEHTVNGKSTEMEIQFVHKTSEGNTAIVAALAKVGEKSNEELQKIVGFLKFVKVKDSIWDFGYDTAKDFDLSKMLPSESPSYYRYTGSMTSPPCEEEVIWSVVKEPISIGKDQIAQFRKLSSSEELLPECMLSRNFRPVQPLNSRTVKLFENQQE